MELRQRVTVGVGGKIEMTLPDATVGEVIDLTVLFERKQPGGVARAHCGARFT